VFGRGGGDSQEVGRVWVGLDRGGSLMVLTLGDRWLDCPMGSGCFDAG
jgi:hypothetical protein